MTEKGLIKTGVFAPALTGLPFKNGAKETSEFSAIKP
jgi:hypothetical protein